MSVQRTVQKEGDGVTKPQPGDTVEVGYTGWHLDESRGANEFFKGKE
jgi:hypothetical protein